jgi:hypothetical protein
MRSTTGLNRWQRQRAAQREADALAHAKSVERLSGPTLKEDATFWYRCEKGHEWTLTWSAGTLLAACVGVCWGSGHHWMADEPLHPVRQVQENIDHEERFVLAGESVPPMTSWTSSEWGQREKENMAQAHAAKAKGGGMGGDVSVSRKRRQRYT